MALGQRSGSQLIVLGYDGSASVDFTMGNTWWLYAVLGSGTSAVVGSADDHTYTPMPALPSFTIENGIDIGTDSVTKLLGAKVNDCTISARVGDPVSVNLNFIYKTETEGTSLDGTPASDSEVAFTFAQGSLQLPSGATIADIQNFELRIGNDLKPIRGLGSRFLTQCVAGGLTYELTVSGAFEAASSFLEKFYGGGTAPQAIPAEQATCVLTFTNGLADAAERTLVITLANLQVDSHSLPQAPNEQTFENMTLIAKDMAAVGTDATTSPTPWN